MWCMPPWLTYWHPFIQQIIYPRSETRSWNLDSSCECWKEATLITLTEPQIILKCPLPTWKMFVSNFGIYIRLPNEHHRIVNRCCSSSIYNIRETPMDRLGRAVAGRRSGDPVLPRREGSVTRMQAILLLLMRSIILCCPGTVVQQIIIILVVLRIVLIDRIAVVVGKQTGMNAILGIKRKMSSTIFVLVGKPVRFCSCLMRWLWQHNSQTWEAHCAHGRLTEDNKQITQ